MERLIRIAKWSLVMLLFLIFIWGCGGQRSPNGPIYGPPMPDPVAISAAKPAPEFALAATDSNQANARLVFTDLRGRTTPAVKGEVEVWAYLNQAQVDHARGDIMSIFLALPFDEADFDNSGDVGFDDLFMFANGFGGSDARFDIDGNGHVDFDDFFIFAEHFNRRRNSVLTKPVVIPETSISETIGRWTANETARAWEILKNPPRRAAKLALAIGYRLVVKSLVGAQFPAVDTLVVGDFTQFRNIEIRVNTPPTAALEPGLKISAVLGDTLRFVVTGLFDSDDKPARYIVEADSAPYWAISQDSILVGRPPSIGTEVVMVRVVDTAGQTWGYGLTVETVAPPPPPDTTPPVSKVSFNTDTTAVIFNVSDNSGQTVWTVATLDAKVIWDDTTASNSIALKLADGVHQLTFVFTDQAKNSSRSEHRLEKPDRTPPVIEILNMRWNGRKFQATMRLTDNLTGIRGYGVYVANPAGGYLLDISGPGGSRLELDVLLEQDFPAVTAPTERILVARCNDQAGNLTKDAKFKTVQPISPEAPPPPPVVTPPPATNVAPTLSATVNGAASGPIVVTAGTTLTLAATVTGTPNPTVTWTLGSQNKNGTSATLTAQSGTLTVTATNSAGTVSKTFTVIALGAP